MILHNHLITSPYPCRWQRAIYPHQFNCIFFSGDGNAASTLAAALTAATNHSNFTPDALFLFSPKLFVCPYPYGKWRHHFNFQDDLEMRTSNPTNRISFLDSRRFSLLYLRPQSRVNVIYCYFFNFLSGNRLFTVHHFSFTIVFNIFSCGSILNVALSFHTYLALSFIFIAWMFKRFTCTVAAVLAMLAATSLKFFLLLTSVARVRRIKNVLTQNGEKQSSIERRMLNQNKYWKCSTESSDILESLEQERAQLIPSKSWSKSLQLL